jgi:hypothetical protein
LIKVEKADFSGNENDFYFETEGVAVYGPAHVTFTIDFFFFGKLASQVAFWVNLSYLGKSV